jgi:hypothetical protein
VCSRVSYESGWSAFDRSIARVRIGPYLPKGVFGV